MPAADGVGVLGEVPLSEQLASLGGPVDLVIDPVWGPWAASALACLKPGGRYLNVGAAAGDATPFHVEWLRAAQLALIGVSATREKSADLFASYQRVAALAASGSLALPTATYPLEEASRSWEAQTSSPGQEDHPDSLIYHAPPAQVGKGAARGGTESSLPPQPRLPWARGHRRA